ncbi:MAG: hypothetical protein ABI675_20325 [Chitinophagaceae bacterium]
METLEFIEAFFDGNLPQDKKNEFEKRIIADSSFAEEVAFYLSAKQTADDKMRNEREKFRTLYSQYKSNTTSNPPVGLVRRLVPWVAAVAVLAGIILGGYLLFLRSSESPQQLAGTYLKEQLRTLSVTMSSTEDSLQKGKRLYNEGKFMEALEQFKKIITTDTTSFTAKKLVGLVYLRMNQYDNALDYFKQLEHYSLYSNPSLFYQAITLLKRGQPGDESKARHLLQLVAENDLEGKKEAEEWLKKW